MPCAARSAAQVAERVGVASLRRRLLAASSMDLGLASAEAFGQSEALTTRCASASDRQDDVEKLILKNESACLPKLSSSLLHRASSFASTERRASTCSLFEPLVICCGCFSCWAECFAAR